VVDRPITSGYRNYAMRIDLDEEVRALRTAGSSPGLGDEAAPAEDEGRHT
jgi:hypothetical protein